MASTWQTSTGWKSNHFCVELNIKSCTDCWVVITHSNLITSLPLSRVWCGFLTWVSWDANLGQDSLTQKQFMETVTEHSFSSPKWCWQATSEDQKSWAETLETCTGLQMYFNLPGSSELQLRSGQQSSSWRLVLFQTYSISVHSVCVGRSPGKALLPFLKCKVFYLA